MFYIDTTNGTTSFCQGPDTDDSGNPIILAVGQSQLTAPEYNGLIDGSLVWNGTAAIPKP